MAIHGFQIKHGNITSDHLADNSVPTAKILDFNITTAKLAAKVLTSDKVADAAITGGAQFNSTVDADGKTFSGAVTFSSPLTVADATASTQAASKGQLDTAITTVTSAVNSLGNAFNLVGNLDAAPQATPFDLDSLTEKDPGDYYAVTTAGYVESAAQPALFVNVGDGLVFDATGKVFKIDNTNSTVAGTLNEIDVTGSTDTGYTLRLSESILNLLSHLTEIAADNAPEKEEQISNLVILAGKKYSLQNFAFPNTVEVYRNGVLQSDHLGQYSVIKENNMVSFIDFSGASVTPLVNGELIAVRYFRSAYKN